MLKRIFSHFKIHRLTRLYSTKSDAHIFSLYSPNLNHEISLMGGKNISNWKNVELHITDKSLTKRLLRVLRVKKGEKFILFDEHCHVNVSYEQETSEGLRVSIVDGVNFKNENRTKVNLFCGILKKDAMEEVCRISSVLGIEKLSFIKTSKIHQMKKDVKLSDKEYDRLHRIIISNCEQAKNFFVPFLESKLFSLNEVLNSIKEDENNICFHANGNVSLMNAMNSLDKCKNVNIFVGPEGDFTHEELDKMQNGKCKIVKLTQTTLRTQDACTVGVGAIVSALYNS